MTEYEDGRGPDAAVRGYTGARWSSVERNSRELRKIRVEHDGVVLRYQSVFGYQAKAPIRGEVNPLAAEAAERSLSTRVLCRHGSDLRVAVIALHVLEHDRFCCGSKRG